MVWDRQDQGGFPEAKELTQRIRDIVAPRLNLGHIDGDDSNITDEEEDGGHDLSEDIDDADAAEMRSFYGVL